MEKLEDKHLNAVCRVALMLSADSLLELIAENTIAELPAEFNKTKLKMIELQEQFNEDMEATIPNYFKEE